MILKKYRSPIPVVIFILFSSLITGCGIPIPEEKNEYIGLWDAPNMSLLITADGRIEYKRVSRHTTTISGPIQEFRGDDFVVGIWFLEVVFKVNRIPYQEDGVWKIVVDEVALTRVPNKL